MKKLGATVVKNAIANVVRGGASAVVAIALPHFLTRQLDHDRFAGWVLMLQIAAYANYLNFGVQTAISRFLAQAMERGDDEARDSLISTSLAMLWGAAIVAIVAFAVVLAFLPHLLPEAPKSLLSELAIGTAELALSAALLLPLSTYTGILIGLHKNEMPALAIGGTRLLGALFVIVAGYHTHSLIWLSFWISIWNLIGGVLQYFMAYRLLPTMRVTFAAIRKPMFATLIHYCTGLTVFSFGMLLVSGLDVSIVGYFSFAAAGPYAIASTLLTFVSGLSFSIFSALLTPIAVLQERGENSKIAQIVLTTTRLSSYVNLLLIILVFYQGNTLMLRWVGPSYAPQALAILEVLVCAQMVRSIGGVYSTALVAIGQQNFGITAALLEGVSNLVLSIVAVKKMGPIGVAWGTLLGSIVGLIALVVYVFPRVTGLPMMAMKFLVETVIRPVGCLSLLIVLLLLPKSFMSYFSAVGAVLLSSFLVYRYGNIRGISNPVGQGNI